ncbi:hypothetical protein B0T11DRAFT_337033 [Plectosphaerella cucumerina]|uniref:DUF7707 domain-containing protein n=1 Tax=Plectosphaerella cucumerina TaxID=40658 RepID=A0A8K0TLG3_9PEZI|nr:hypothetical protein B0T11DRAFT_337033 [Plectosphaerella cucumerina]
MRSFAVLAVAFATAAVAQSSSNSSKVYTVEDLGPVFSTLSDSTKRDWCRGQNNGCEDLCGGRNNWEVNDCDDNTLVYECKCNDGKVPPLEDYTNTMPTHICLAVFDACMTSHPNDRDGQDQCLEARKASCEPTELLDPAEANTADSNTSTAATTTTSSAASESTGEASNTASADAADATASTTTGDSFAAPTAAPAAGAAAVAMVMVAYLV